jgi:hypothetical protein
MSSDTPIAPVPGLDTILADVEQLAKEAHTFIARDKPTHRQIASEWVPICTKLKRRLQQLGHWIDEVPAELREIVLAGRDGGGLSGTLPPGVWREHEAKRHAKILEQLANIKSTLATVPPDPPLRLDGDQAAGLEDDDKSILTALAKFPSTYMNAQRIATELRILVRTDRQLKPLGQNNIATRLRRMETFGYVRRPPGKKQKGGYCITPLGGQALDAARTPVSK